MIQLYLVPYGNHDWYIRDDHNNIYHIDGHIPNEIQTREFSRLTKYPLVDEQDYTYIQKEFKGVIEWFKGNMNNLKVIRKV